MRRPGTDHVSHSPWCSPLGTMGKEHFYQSRLHARQHSDLFLPPSNVGTLCSSVYQQLLTAFSVLPLFSSSRQSHATVHVHEKSPELRGLIPKAVIDGETVNTVYALNMANLHILTCVSLWTLMLFLTGVSVLLSSCLTATKPRSILW